VADEPENTPDAPVGPRATDQGRADPRTYQRNLAERLFPGPSRKMSEQFAQHIEGLITEGGNEEAIKAWRERQARRAAGESGARRRRDGPKGSLPASAELPELAAPATTPEDIAALSEKLEQQNELLRAILASNVDTQSDARSTAQNSRTFAWAGTAIALLTLIATVISIVAAIQGH
jgi:hypothetical protein